MELAVVSLVVIVLVLVYFLLEIHYFFRQLISYLHSRFFKKKLHVLDVSTYSSICLTTDIDVLLYHMNNARYLREVDFARTDFLTRTGLWQRLREKGGSLFQGATSIRYRRFIRLFSLYHITTQVVYWDESSFYTEHRFISKHDNFIRAIIYGRTKIVNCNVEELMADLMKNPLTKTSNDIRLKPECPPEIKLWDESTMVSRTKLRASSESV